MSATGVDQSTESTEKAQAHQGPGCALISVITHLTKTLSRTPEFSSLLLRRTTRRSASFGVVSPQLAGHLYLNYEVNKIEETSYFSSSYELLKDVPN